VRVAGDGVRDTSREDNFRLERKAMVATDQRLFPQVLQDITPSPSLAIEKRSKGGKQHM